MFEYAEEAGIALLLTSLGLVARFVIKWILDDATDPGSSATERRGDTLLARAKRRLGGEAGPAVTGDPSLIYEESDPAEAAKREEIERALKDLLNGTEAGRRAGQPEGQGR